MAVKFKDYYQTLGVPRTASADEIKQAFRRLARLHHPDVAKNKAAGEEKFKEINEAYEVLGDADKRRRYDELGAGWDQAGPGPFGGAGGAPGGMRGGDAGADFEFGGTGFSDFFESFFSDRRPRSGGRGRRTATNFEQPGQDVEADLLVTLEEVLHGSKRKVTLRRADSQETQTYQVRIPPGMREGESIRLAGQGGPGYGGAAAGDLYLRVRLARHPDFSVQGDDLHCELVLAPWEAVLGTKARIPTLDGTVAITVPAGSVAGSQLRVRGFGLPHGEKSRGDLYATLQVQVPASVTAEQRALWEKLAQVSDFHPRSAKGSS